MSDRLAKVYQFPVKGLTCENCVNVLYGRSGIYCREFREDIFDPDIAENCDAYEPED